MKLPGIRTHEKKDHRSEFFLQTFSISQRYSLIHLFRERLVLYTILIISLISWFYFLGKAQLNSSFELYTLSSFISTLLTLVISAMSLIKYYTRKDHKYLFIGFGFLTTAILHAYQAIFAPLTLGDNFADASSRVYYFWVINHLILSLFLAISWIYWYIDRNNTYSKSRVYSTSSVIMALSIGTILLLPMPYLRTIHAFVIVLLVFSAIGYVLKAQWKNKYFEHWFTMSLIVNLFAQGARIFSTEAFDSYFTGAYALEILSYSFVVVGLLMSMYLAFEEVEEGKDKIDTILRSIGDGVFVVDASGNIILINNVAERLSGYSYKTAMGKSYKEIFKFSMEEEPNKPYPPIIEDVIRTGTIKELRTHTLLWQKDGTSVPVSDSAAPIQDKSGAVIGCIVVLRDISRQRELERTKDNFLSVAAHQLRTPLGAMKWNLEMLLSGDLGKLTALSKQQLEQIFESNQRMITMVNDLLNVSRIDQMRVADHPAETDVVTVIRNVISELKTEAFKHQVTIILSPAKPVLPHILIDADRLHQVIENLVSNAVKYNKNRGTVTISAKPNHQTILIAIADTGMGIPKKDQQEIFSKFFRARNAVTSAADGTGLGLFVVQSYIKGWGGSIRFESTEGSGTTFYITLPLHPRKHALSSNIAAQPHTIQ